MVCNLPDVRWEKVSAAREALRHHRYDTEEVLDKTVESLADDIDVSLLHR